MTDTQTTLTEPLATGDTVTPETTQTPSGEQPQAIETPWYSKLSDEYKSNAAITKFSSEEELAKGYINAQSMIGKRVNELSADELRSLLSADELIQVARSKEMPESLDNYELNLGLRASEQETNDYKKFFFENGISPKQAAAIAEGLQAKQAEALERQKQAYLDATYERFGAKATEVVDTAKRAMAEFATPEIRKLMDSSGLGNNPDVIQFLANIGRTMQEHRLPHRAGHSDNGASVAAIKSEIQSKLNDKEFKKRWNNQERGATNELNALYQRLYQLEG